MRYSDRLSQTPYWERMAHSTYASRMQERATTYPMSQHNPGEYALDLLPAPYPDPATTRPLLEVGEDMAIPALKVPVIFTQDVLTPEGEPIGRKHETRYVESSFMRTELHPMHFAVYATPEAYRLLGLPVVDHRVHQEIPKTRADYRKLRAKQLWADEPWRFTFDFMFREHRAGPPELLDDDEEWNGVEETAPTTGAATGAVGGGRKGPVKIRKARKVKLF